MLFLLQMYKTFWLCSSLSSSFFILSWWVECCKSSCNKSKHLSLLIDMFHFWFLIDMFTLFYAEHFGVFLMLCDNFVIVIAALYCDLQVLIWNGSKLHLVACHVYYFSSEHMKIFNILIVIRGGKTLSPLLVQTYHKPFIKI